VLAQLDGRLQTWQAALDGAGPYPESFTWPAGLGPCPSHLEARANRILAAQRDLQARMAARRAALGGALTGTSEPSRHREPPLFVDQRI
jgi:hypothetical protein